MKIDNLRRQVSNYALILRDLMETLKPNKKQNLKHKKGETCAEYYN